MTYIHFQDLVSAYVGPFNSQTEVDDHIRFCAARGDAASFLGLVDAPPADASLVMTPAEDRDFDVESVIKELKRPH